MKENIDYNKKPDVPHWLSTGVMSLNDIIDIIIDNSNYDPRAVKEAMMAFQKQLFDKLKTGYSVKSAFGTFYPHFKTTNPNSNEKVLTVEFVPTKKMLKEIEERKMKRLNNIMLN